MKYDFVVIGAGVSGLTSAITLAKSGYRVALVEKSERTAPVLRGFSRKGVHFDTGFHYTGGLAPGEPLDIFFRYLGISDRVTSFPFDTEGFDVFRCENPGFEFRVPAGYARLRERLCEAFPVEAKAIDSYLGMVKAVCASMPYLNLDAEVDTGFALRRVLGATLKETLDSLTGNELLKSVLSMHSLLYGVSSCEVSFTQHAAIVGNYYDSARGIRGSGLSLVNAFDERLKLLGVDLFCGAEVTRVLVDAQGAVAGVELASGAALSCPACIATVHPRVLLDLAPEGAFRPAYRKRLGALEETVSAFMAYAVSTAPIASLAGSNLFLLPEADCLNRLGQSPLDKAPFYLSAAYREGGGDPSGYIAIFPSLFKETAAWEGSSSGRRPEEYRQFKKEALSIMQRRIERVCPEIAGNLQYLEGSTPLTLRDFCSTPYGGLYGVKHMVGQYNPQTSTKLRGLYLAGQAVVSPGVMGAVLSGLLACGTILGHDRMRKELKACC